MSEGASILTEGLGQAAPPVTEVGSQGNVTANGEVVEKQIGDAGPGLSRVAIAEEYRSHPSLSKFLDDEGTVDPNVLAKSYVHAQGLIGGDKVALPKGEDDQEGLERVYTALGRPESPDNYEVKRPEELPAGVEYDEEGEKYFRQVAHSNGWSQKQFDNAYKSFFEHQAKVAASWQQHQAQAREAAEQALRREQGQAYDGFVGSARSVLQQYGDEDFIRFLNESGLGNDARLIRFVGKVGRDMGGDAKLLDGQNGGQTSTADLEEKIAKYREENWSALTDRAHADHDRCNKEMQRMFNQLHGS